MSAYTIQAGRKSEDSSAAPLGTKIIKNLIKVGHFVVNDYSMAGMQVRRDGSSEKMRQRRNASCVHRALTRTLKKRILGRSVSLF